MDFHPASPPSIVAFLLVCGAVVGMLLRGIWVSAVAEGHNPVSRTLWCAGGLALCLVLLSSLIASGWVQAKPGRLPLFGGGIIVGCLLLGFSRIGKWLALSPIQWLLAFQGFRLPLELLLRSWVKQGVIPATMTWTGSNWDVLSGIAALLLAPFARRSLLAAWVGNLIGLALLLNVGRVAILSSPVPFGWREVTPKLELVYHLPYALILPICIGGALVGHIALTRALLGARRSGT